MAAAPPTATAEGLSRAALEAAAASPEAVAAASKFRSLPPASVVSLLEGAEGAKRRFELELEFVELLANPFYLQHLAQRRYLEDPAFLGYLEYLQCWRAPEYCKFISHPHALFFLELLQCAEFRARLLDPSYVMLIHENQLFHWRYSRWNRFQRKHMKGN